ncbi:EAL domain-containing protein [Arhodomonas sp. SL1]|uniref:EAL domain-containing protein n=1 Tax=Arhodomonas sp. SL1 TaxID=3425691 RepID=UPI003F880718
MPSFLRGGGEMGRRIRELDWSSTPIGAVHTWPQTLRTAIGIMLNSGYPMYIAWGPEFVQFYNDAYAPIFGSKHPQALGRGTAESWGEIWDEVGPMFRGVLETGEPVTVTDHCFVMYRHGYPEDCYFDFSYSALCDEEGIPRGVLVTCAETTEAVLQARRMAMLQGLDGSLHDALSRDVVYSVALESLCGTEAGVPFVLFYEPSGDGTELWLRGHRGCQSVPPSWRALRSDSERPWPLAQALGGDEVTPAQHWRDERLRLTPGRAAGAPAEAVVIPVAGTDAGQPDAVLVLGVDPRRRLDEPGLRFFQLIRQHLEKALRRAMAHEQSLAGARRRAEAVFEMAREGIVVCSPEGRIIEANPAFADMVGETGAGLAGVAFPRLVADDEHYAVRDLLRRARVAEGAFGQLRLSDRDGAARLVEVNARPLDDGAGGQLFLVIHDISERLRHEALLAHQASHDALTELINRYEFERRLDALLDKPLAGDAGHALAYIDLDQFKVVNDTCGHTAGDELLRELARRMQEPLAGGHTLARLGGDEFGVILSNVGIEHAEAILTRLLQSIEGYRFDWAGEQYPVTASVGLVEIPPQGASRVELVSRADNACFAAKEEGRNRIKTVPVTDTTLVDARRNAMSWVSRIVDALDSGRLFLEYQPIVPAREEALGRPAERGELLVRLCDRMGSIVPPDHFIPPAERFNLMPRVDRWVIGHALSHLAAREGSDAGVYGINVSGNSLSEPGFADFVLETIDASGISPRRLCFEITETAAVTYLDSCIEFVSRLRAIGCEIALDDFGSGFSSYAYLERIPCDCIKIDGHFVRDIADSPSCQAIVESIVSVSQRMGLRTIAEWVERRETVSLLQGLGVDYVQGFGVAPYRNWLE